MEEYRVERENHPFNHRQFIYGVVSVDNNSGRYFFRWNVEGFLNIDRDEASNINFLIYDEDALIFIRCKENSEVNQDSQIGLFSYMTVKNGIFRSRRIYAILLSAAAVEL